MPKTPIILTTQEPKKPSNTTPAEPQIGSKKDSSQSDEAAPTPKDKTESGVKKALNKWLGVFKKKK